MISQTLLSQSMNLPGRRWTRRVLLCPVQVLADPARPRRQQPSERWQELRSFRCRSCTIWTQ